MMCIIRSSSYSWVSITLPNLKALGLEFLEGPEVLVRVLPLLPSLSLNSLLSSFSQLYYSGSSK